MNTLIRNAPTFAARWALVTTLAAAVGVGLPPSAVAATDLGAECAVNGTGGNTTVIMTARTGSDSLPITPAARGVITRAAFNVPESLIGSFPHTVKVVRGTGTAHEYAVTTQSPVLPLSGSERSFDVRLPMEPGDLLGVWGSLSTFMCGTGVDGDRIGYVAGDVQPGQAATFTPLAGWGIPVVVTVEPDVDGDGYGDETQDACQRSASVQTTCPAITLDSSASARRRSLLVVVSADNPARVTVTGTAKVAGRKITLHGGTRMVAPGRLGRFTVRYPKALRTALAALPPGRSLTVRLTARTTDRIGKVTRDSSRVRIAAGRG